MSIRLSTALLFFSLPALGDVSISEFGARNDGTIDDGFGQSSDWIELHNSGPESQSLVGYRLTDDPTGTGSWALPDVILQPGAQLLVFATGLDLSTSPDAGDYYHTNFRLGGDGEYLALTDPAGEVVSEFAPTYPPQFPDISYGTNADGNSSFFAVPTPGEPNTAPSFEGVVADTTFSQNRGFYDAPISVSISSATPGATIRYTLDGSAPSADNGEAYTAPLEITTTTALRAMATKDGFVPTNVDAHTYIFVDDVLTQPAVVDGYPEDWGSDGEVPRRVAADYEMDPEVVGNTTQTYSVKEALLDIPTMSVTLDPDDFLGSRNGIYNHPRSTGSRWEKACSVELIHPDRSPGFQETCALVIHGGSSRRPWRMQKHSFRLEFRSAFGASKLRYPLVPGATVDEFNKLVLRACFTDSWGLVSWSASRYRPDDSQYIRDVWVKESMKQMGNLAGNGTFVHLYINGLYWGLYNPSERMDSAFYSEHRGGAREDWDVLHDFNELRSGSRSAWSKLHRDARDAEDEVAYNALQGLGPDGIPDPELANLINIDNFIDFMLLHFHAKAEDWPHHNWYAARKSRNANEGFTFQPWDQEIVLDNLSINKLNSNDAGTPGALLQNLRRNDEFRLRFADRTHKHLHNDGALSLSRSQTLYRQLADRIDKAIVAESARWGDTSDSTPYGNRAQKTLYTRDDDWVVERNVVINEFLPDLHDSSNSRSTLRRLRSANLYPDTEPPAFSQHGGLVGSGFRLAISAPAGTVYYTTDGSDPRARPAVATFSTIFDDGTNATAQIPTDDSFGDNWQAIEFNDTGWLSGKTGLGFEGVPGDYDDVIQLYVPDMQGANATAYLRIPFAVEAPDALSGLILSVKYDDGFVAYLNGVKVASANAPGTTTWDSRATSSHPDSKALIFEPFDISSFVSSLVPGENILAIQGLNQSATSSDFLISAKLEGIMVSTDIFSPTAKTFSDPIQLPIVSTVKARVLNGEEWSPLTEATFLSGSVASTSNLTISEILYNPSGTSNTEFIEIANISTNETVHLTGVTFSTGIQFVFPDHLWLAPGQAVVAVADRVAFQAAYPSVGEHSIAGEFADGTSLANGGETVTLRGANGGILREITYDDSAPWPDAADGQGSSLELVNPFENPDPSDPANWQTDASPGGSPGITQRRPVEGFTGDPLADLDGDGLYALLEYATGRSDEASDVGNMPFSAEATTIAVDGTSESYYTFVFARNNTRLDVSLEVEVSQDLTTWTSSSDEVVLHSENIGNVHDQVTYRSSSPLKNSPKPTYFRLSAKFRQR